MSVVEDVRKVLQDTLAPDLKALTVRVEELERRMDLRFQALDGRIDGVEKRFDDQRAYLEKRFDGLERMLSQQQLISSLAERIHILENATRTAPSSRKESEIERAG